MTLLNLIRVERKTSKNGNEFFSGTVIADTEITLKPGDQIMMFRAFKEVNDGNTFNMTCERFEFVPRQKKQPTPTSPARGFGRQNAADPEGAVSTNEAKARYAENGNWKTQDSRTEVLGYGHTARVTNATRRDPDLPSAARSNRSRPSKSQAAASIRLASAGAKPKNTRPAARTPDGSGFVC